jgi:hypothetical protein
MKAIADILNIKYKKKEIYMDNESIEGQSINNKNFIYIYYNLFYAIDR